MSEQTFTEINGSSVATGQWVSSTGRTAGDSGLGLPKKSRDVTFEHAKNEIYRTITGLNLPSSLHPLASRFYHLAVDRKFTQGRQRQFVIGTCIYVAARRENSPVFLMDIAELLSVSEKRLARTVRDFVRAMGIHVPTLDPSIFLGRYIEQLDLPEADPEDPSRNPKHLISETARRVVQSMKRDWMQLGRRPAGVCGAALIVACKAHNYPKTVQDIVSMVNITNHTLRKRLRDLSESAVQYMSAVELSSMVLDTGSAPPSEARKSRRRASASAVAADMASIDSLLEGFLSDDETGPADKSQPPAQIANLAGDAEALLAQSSLIRALDARDELPDVDDIEAFERDRELSAAADSNTRTPPPPPIPDCFSWETEFDQSYMLAEIPDEDIAGYVATPEEAEERRVVWEEHYKERYDEIMEKRRRRDSNTEKRLVASRISRKRAKADAPATASEAASQVVRGRRVSSRIDFDRLAAALDEPAEQQQPTTTELPSTTQITSSPVDGPFPARVPPLPRRNRTNTSTSQSLHGV